MRGTAFGSSLLRKQPQVREGRRNSTTLRSKDNIKPICSNTVIKRRRLGPSYGGFFDPDADGSRFTSLAHLK